MCAVICFSLCMHERTDSDRLNDGDRKNVFVFIYRMCGLNVICIGICKSEGLYLIIVI